MITLTDSAREKIADILAEENNPRLKIRAFVQGGGCSGFQYEFSLTNNVEKSDIEFVHNGAKVIIDDMSINYLKGSVVDYTDTLLESSFKIDNPNASSSCGCGVSFTI